MASATPDLRLPSRPQSIKRGRRMMWWRWITVFTAGVLNSDGFSRGPLLRNAPVDRPH